MVSRWNPSLHLHIDHLTRLSLDRAAQQAPVDLDLGMQSAAGAEKKQQKYGGKKSGWIDHDSIGRSVHDGTTGKNNSGAPGLPLLCGSRRRVRSQGSAPIDSDRSRDRGSGEGI